MWDTSASVLVGSVLVTVIRRHTQNLEANIATGVLSHVAAAFFFHVESIPVLGGGAGREGLSDCAGEIPRLEILRISSDFS